MSFLPLLLSTLRTRQFRSPIASVVNETTVDLLRNLLSLDDYVDVAEQLNQSPDIKNLLEFMLFVIRNGYFSIDTNVDLSRRARELMSKIISKWPLLPSSLFLAGVSVPSDLSGGGGSGFDFKGEHEGKAVALKLLHNTRNLDFCRELLMWRSLRHKFVLPFLGVYENEASQFFLVTPHMTNGTLAQWRKKTAPLMLEVEKRLLEVAQGVHYIHSEGVVHGDLCGANILLNDKFHVQIADFGLSRHSGAAVRRSKALHCGFAAPELIGYSENNGSSSEDSTSRTQDSDVYAYGCLYYEIYYDIIPFEGSSALQIVRAVCRGERPPRPKNPPLRNNAWMLINQCWSQKKQTRPGMGDVVKTMESWKVSSPGLSSASTYPPNPISGTLESVFPMVPAPRLLPMRRVPSPFVPQGELHQGIRRPSTIKEAVKRMIHWRTRQMPPPAPIATTPPSLRALRGVSSMPSIVSASDTFPTVSSQRLSITISLAGSFDNVYLQQIQQHSDELSFLPVQSTSQFINRDISASPQAQLAESSLAVSSGKSSLSLGGSSDNDEQSFLVVPGTIQSIDCDISNSPLLPSLNSSSALSSEKSLSPSGSSDNIYLQQAQQHSEDQSFLAVQIPRSCDISESPSDASDRSSSLGGSPDNPNQQLPGQHAGEPPALGAQLVLQDPVCFQHQTNGRLPVESLSDFALLRQEHSPLPPPPVLRSLLALLKLEPTVSIGSNVNQFTVDLMCRLLALSDYRTIASELTITSDIELLLDFILYLLDNNYLPTQTMPEISRKARWLMFKLLSQTPVTPKSLFITDVTAELSPRSAIGMGGFGYIYKGEYKNEQVALKSLYKKSHQSKSLERDFCREALVWRSLSHPYILPLLGIFEVESQLFLVSPFMKNGTLAKWRANSQPSVGEIRRKILEVAEGIRYIHSEGIVHGDLRGSNVLLDDSFHAQITDFGLTRHSDVTVSSSATALTLRFAAPELFGMCSTCGQRECECFGGNNVQNSAKTLRTDIYAFGCLYYEIYSNTMPFATLNDYRIMWRVTNGERPERLGMPRMDDAEWDLVQLCWDSNPYARPTIEQVVETMKSMGHAPQS